MRDQIITETMADALQADAARDHVQFGWIILRDQPDYPGEIIARFATEHPTVYVLTADSVAEIRQRLPAGLERSERHPADPPDLVEIWFSPP